MSTLEQAINNALERGEFVHLSVVAKDKGFSATFASASRAGGFSTGEGADPIVAMVRAISAAPMARKATKIISTDDDALS